MFNRKCLIELIIFQSIRIYLHMNEQELVKKLDELIALKDLEIKNQNYELAAQIRDDIRRYNTQLEELMNNQN